MNTHDPFEKRLHEQPFQLPRPEWKEAILARANAPIAVEQTPLPLSARALSIIRAFWLDWIQPYRITYSTLAALWIVIALLRATTPSDPACEQLAQNIKLHPQFEARMIAQWQQQHHVATSKL
jgi:hypothetical protein